MIPNTALASAASDTQHPQLNTALKREKEVRAEHARAQAALPKPPLIDRLLSTFRPKFTEDRRNGFLTRVPVPVEDVIDEPADLKRQRDKLAELQATFDAKIQAKQQLCAEWAEKIQELERQLSSYQFLSNQIDQMKAECDGMREGLRQIVSSYWVALDYSSARRNALAIANHEPAIAEFESVKTAMKETITAHAAEMLVWGAKNNVPADALAPVREVSKAL